MEDRKIAVHVELGRRQTVALAVLALVAFRPAPLSTEQLTLTTYYPSPYGVYSQMRTTNDAYLAYSGGNVGVGTNAPSSKLHVVGSARVSGDSQFDSRLGLGGAFTDQYATGLSVLSRNVHVQGNENGNSWLRVGDAWGYNGVYSESGDLVMGSASGAVRVGPNDTQYLASSCRMIGYAFGTTTSCPSNWSVYSFADSSGRMFDSPSGGTAMPLPTVGQMLCCKMQPY